MSLKPFTLPFKVFSPGYEPKISVTGLYKMYRLILKMENNYFVHIVGLCFPTLERFHV